MTRTVCLDDDRSNHFGPRVVVRRHQVDWDDPAPETAKRAEAILFETPNQCVYVNPAVTITCSRPTANFFREVRKRQAEWCRRAGRMIPQWTRSRVSRWVGPGQTFSTKSERYLHRALCYTGILFIDGGIVPPCQWVKSEVV